MEGFLGIGFWEILLIFIVILALLGPRRLPEIAARIGTLFRKLKRASHDLTSELSKEVDGTRDAGEKPWASLESVKQAASDLASSLTKRGEDAPRSDGESARGSPAPKPAMAVDPAQRTSQSEGKQPGEENIQSDTGTQRTG
jgi:Tat protein translocase TatB subunit